MRSVFALPCPHATENTASINLPCVDGSLTPAPVSHHTIPSCSIQIRLGNARHVCVIEASKSDPTRLRLQSQLSSYHLPVGQTNLFSCTALSPAARARERPDSMVDTLERRALRDRFSTLTLAFHAIFGRSSCHAIVHGGREHDPCIGSKPSPSSISYVSLHDRNARIRFMQCHAACLCRLHIQKSS